MWDKFGPKLSLSSEILSENVSLSITIWFIIMYVSSNIKLRVYTFRSVFYNDFWIVKFTVLSIGREIFKDEFLCWWKKAILSYFKLLSQHLLGETEDKLQEKYPTFVFRVKPKTSLPGSKYTNHSITWFSKMQIFSIYVTLILDRIKVRSLYSCTAVTNPTELGQLQ
jgi:hypothetical protein